MNRRPTRAGGCGGGSSRTSAASCKPLGSTGRCSVCTGRLQLGRRRGGEQVGRGSGRTFQNRSLLRHRYRTKWGRRWCCGTYPTSCSRMCADLRATMRRMCRNYREGAAQTPQVRCQWFCCQACPLAKANSTTPGLAVMAPQRRNLVAAGGAVAIAAGRAMRCALHRLVRAVQVGVGAAQCVVGPAPWRQHTLRRLCWL